MASRQKLGKLILEEDEYRNKGWQTISLLDTDTRLGNFVWKRPRSFIIKVLWEKYISVKTDENLVEFLEECENQNFHFQTKSRTEPLSQTIWEKMIHASIDVDGVGASATDTIKRSNPIRELRITSLVRSELEKQLRSVKLNMESEYIQEKMLSQFIPCIINSIVSAEMPDDPTIGIATEETERHIEGHLKKSLESKIDGLASLPREMEAHGSYTNKTESKACVYGPVLYRVLPLEVDQDGHITAKDVSRGFIKDNNSYFWEGYFVRRRDVQDLTGLEVAGLIYKSDDFRTILGGMDMTQRCNVRKIEELLKPLIGNQAAATAFKDLLYDDITQLCRLIEDIEGDVDLPDETSEKCRDILQFANFKQESGRLKLQERYICNNPFISCYYFAVLLEEIPGTIRNLIEQSTDSLYSLLKTILLETNLEEIFISEDILNCPKSTELLGKLDIVVDGSAIKRIPKSLEHVATAAWITLLYNGPSKSVQ